jgi:hypothetical protein
MSLSDVLLVGFLAALWFVSLFLTVDTRDGEDWRRRGD